MRSAIDREDTSELELIASPGQVRELMEHPGWRDVVTFFSARIEDHLKKLETVGTVEELRYSQGIIANARDILDFPDQLIEWAEYEQEEIKSDG